MGLGQLLSSMVLAMFRLPSGGAMDSLYPSSILSFGSELEGFGGSSLAYGEVIGHQNLPTWNLVLYLTFVSEFPLILLQGNNLQFRETCG